MSVSHPSHTKLAPLVYLYDNANVRPRFAGKTLVLAQIASTAFGDGSHATTRLCAAAVDHLCRTQTCHSFLDVGTGTGVLARIARARGAAKVFATDIDVAARTSAVANAALDASSVDISVSAHAPDHWGSCFDLVVANILEQPLLQLSPALAHALVVNGTLLISGFTQLQSPSLRYAFESQGLICERMACEDDWCLLMFERPH